MPAQTDAHAPIPADAREWRPQRPLASRRPRAITNALLEPLWDGDHVLLHFDVERPTHDGESWVLIVDDLGAEIEDVGAELLADVRRAIRAGDAVIDGFLTRQATRSPETVSTAPVAKTKVSLMHGLIVEANLAPLEQAEPTPIAFVAVDLLRVDGQDLFDVPLLERKRILESVIAPSDRVRVSPYTQPPLNPWLRAWTAAGFRGVMLKAANSRYWPDHDTEEWQEATAAAHR